MSYFPFRSRDTQTITKTDKKLRGKTRKVTSKKGGFVYFSSPWLFGISLEKHRMTWVESFLIILAEPGCIPALTAIPH